MKNFLMTIFICLIAISANAQNNTKRTYIGDLRNYKYDNWVIEKGVEIDFSDSTTGVVKTIRKYKENNNEIVYVGIKLGKDVIDFDIDKEITNGHIKTPDRVNKNQLNSTEFYANDRNMPLNNVDSLNRQVKFLSMRVSELDNRVRVSGYGFQKYHKQHTTGTILLLLGSGVAVGGFASGSTAAGAVGAGVSLIGAIISLNAPIHIKRAGIVLSGNGITIPIKYR